MQPKGGNAVERPNTTVCKTYSEEQRIVAAFLILHRIFQERITLKEA